MKISWVTLLFITLTDRSLRLRQKLWRGLYNKIVSRDKLGQFLFMNYGFEDQHNKKSLCLEPEDEPFRYFIQLYHFVVQNLELQNKDVMEVGSGRGGGGSFIIRYKKPRSFIGIDLSEKAINWCKHYFQFENTNWIQGFADALPVADKSIDVIINVESSHCYPSMQKFLNEVRRTLRPNGYLAFCDLRRSSGIKNLEEAISQSGLEIFKQQEITNQVLIALNHISTTRADQITSIFPRIFCSAIRDFAAVKNTVVYKMLETGQMKYLFYLLKKKA